MRRWGLAVVLVFGVVLLGRAAADEARYAGYSSQAARVERDWEEEFRAIPSPDRLRDSMKLLSARPHHVGSVYDHQNAEWILGRFKEWGLDAHIEKFDVLFPTPKERVVELIAPTKFIAKLREPALPSDPTSSQQDEQLPTYNAYSRDGDVSGSLVYVNYGIPDDYEQLERQGVSVKGAIVIARYGESWRGIKPKVAAEHGAIGCLIYSDPRDDGYTQGDTFPGGAWRPPDGVQRGSVMRMELFPGNPLREAEIRQGTDSIPLRQAKTLTDIPVLPISYGDAQPLLAALGGPVAPEKWRGALPLAYHIGPGPAKVHLKVEANWDIKTLHDVVARIPGAELPDEWIVRGNHHDAWVNGAEDPISALVALLEEARGLGELLKHGWRPRRTIVYCAWDGEEEGLLGSTAWAEAHADELRQHAALYINTDGNGRGYLFASGSHTLEKFVNEVARDIVDPEKSISVWKRAQLAMIAHASTAEERQEIRKRGDLRIGALGSGSDYTAFIDHLGVASLNLGYTGEDGGGIYHSIYDDFYWYTHFSDSSFVYGRALAETVGTAAMRLADAELLPYDFSNFSETIRKYVDELEKLLKNKREEIQEKNLEIEEGVFTATSDPRKPLVPPEVEPVPPHLNFAPLENAAEMLSRSAGHYQKAVRKAQENDGAGLDRAQLSAVNKLLIESERKLTSAGGLPGRPWFKHLIYAPGSYTGYAVKTIPGVREAIEQKKWQEAETEIARAARALQDEAELISSAAAKLEEATR